MKREFKRVVEAVMEYASGRSIFPPYIPLANVWRLTLECGHEVYRQPRYVPVDQGKGFMARKTQKGWFSRRHAEDALPAPKKVICRKCENIGKLWTQMK